MSSPYLVHMMFRLWQFPMTNALAHDSSAYDALAHDALAHDAWA